MDAFEAIKNRHSYRGPYTNTQVPREDLKKIMEAGLSAPSGCNKQTTSLIGLDDPKLVDVITKIVNKNGFSGKNAPCAICVLTQKIPGYANVFFNVQDYSAAVENILVAAVALGYATCWVEGQVTENTETQKEIAKLLHIPYEYDIVAFLPIGVPEKEIKRPAYKPFNERAWFNSFGNNV